MCKACYVTVQPVLLQAVPSTDVASWLLLDIVQINRALLSVVPSLKHACDHKKDTSAKVPRVKHCLCQKIKGMNCTVVPGPTQHQLKA